MTPDAIAMARYRGTSPVHGRGCRVLAAKPYRRAWAGAAALALGLLLVQPATAFEVVGDGIPGPLAASGDAARGRALVADRTRGLCLLCHSGPFPEERFQGNLGPSLEGAGSRLTEAQLRLRIADGRRLNPDSIMPSYFRVDGLHRVGAAWRGRTLLAAQEIEDIVAFLLTLKAP